MRLYLSSNDLGDFSDKLLELVGDNRKTLIISNARDHRSPEDRSAVVEEDMGILRNSGLIPTELDLRNYFGKSEELRKYIDDFEPGCIFVMGGNLYSIATVMHLSGMDEILKHDLVNDKYVYGGYSAGSMFTSHDLLNYLESYGRRSDDRLEQAKELYGEVFTDGLGLIGEYIAPHADEEKFSDACKKAKSDFKEKNLELIVLNNSDVVVVNGNNLEVFGNNHLA